VHDDPYLSRLWGRVGNLIEDQLIRSAEVAHDNCLHGTRLQKGLCHRDPAAVLANRTAPLDIPVERSRPPSLELSDA
jgi:hypothetical protein